MSILLRPTFEPTRAAMVSLVAAVAGRAALEKHGLSVGIKWPNDLLAGEPARKLSGILAEMRAGAAGIEFIVLGIGFNLNVAADGFPPELAGIATSYRAQTGHRVSRAEFAADFLNQLETWYDRLSAGDLGGVIEQWRSVSITLGRAVRFELPGGSREGRAIDIDVDGALLVETREGIQRVTAGDVHLIEGL